MMMMMNSHTQSDTWPRAMHCLRQHKMHAASWHQAMHCKVGLSPNLRQNHGTLPTGLQEEPVHRQNRHRRAASASSTVLYGAKRQDRGSAPCHPKTRDASRWERSPTQWVAKSPDYARPDLGQPNCPGSTSSMKPNKACIPTPTIRCGRSTHSESNNLDRTDIPHRHLVPRPAARRPSLLAGLPIGLVVFRVSDALQIARRNPSPRTAVWTCVPSHQATVHEPNRLPIPPIQRPCSPVAPESSSTNAPSTRPGGPITDGTWRSVGGMPRSR